MNQTENVKPLGRKAYGSIGHLPESRLGPGDHKVTDGQARIACIKTRDRHDRVYVTEKLDGSNVAVARVGGEIIALGRAGYRAQTSPYEQHQLFAHWVRMNEARFAWLAEGWSLSGEWLAQAHGTRYRLEHDPFSPFDLFSPKGKRVTYESFRAAVCPHGFTPPRWINPDCRPMSVAAALEILGPFGFHGGLDPVEGAVWRVERATAQGTERELGFDFMCKYVRPDKVDGSMLPDVSGNPIVWNWRP